MAPDPTLVFPHPILVVTVCPLPHPLMFPLPLPLMTATLCMSSLLAATTLCMLPSPLPSTATFCMLIPCIPFSLSLLLSFPPLLPLSPPLLEALHPSFSSLLHTPCFFRVASRALGVPLCACELLADAGHAGEQCINQSINQSICRPEMITEGI